MTMINLCVWRKFLIFTVGYAVLITNGMSSTVHAASVNFEILNKVSAKKTPLKIQANSSTVIHDLRIVPGECRREKDTFEGEIYWVPVQILLEQESDEPVELYNGELASSPRYPQKPIEHSLYDIILVGCE
ncbi:MAG: DUF2155 domain-containing protein [Candidatus Paracaedibacteraceae bacterium]|nr:DUF2155 domain-containing protein [Candidatus Paracaedibacteraceae bacterium]